MDANSKKVMEKSVEKSVTKEESTIEESLGGTKEAPEYAAATIEESLGGTKETSKSVAFAVEKPLAGNKKDPEKSPEKPLENTKPGNKAEKTKPNVNVEPIAGTYKNEDANLQKLYTVSEKKRHPSNLKRSLNFFQKNVQENEGTSNKKLKTHAREETVDSVQITHVKYLVNQKEQEMPKLVVDPEFIKNARGAIGAMSRSEVDDLVIQKMVEEKKSKFHLEYMRSQLVISENTLATYRRKIATMSHHFHELDKMTAKKSHFNRFAAGQNVILGVKSKPHAAGSMLSASIGIPTKAGPPNAPKPVEENKPNKQRPHPGQAENNILKTTQLK